MQLVQLYATTCKFPKQVKHRFQNLLTDGSDTLLNATAINSSQLKH